MQPLGDMTFYQMITWQIKNIISQHLQWLQSPKLVGTHVICHVIYYMSFIIFLYVIYMSTCHVIT